MGRNNWRNWLLALGVLAVMPGLPSAQAFELNGFGDVTWDISENHKTGGSNNGFRLGQLDFYIAEQLTDRLDILAEYVIESPGSGFAVDLERLQVGYAVNNNSKFRAGRFHNLMGYWNLAYHHGAQLQTSVDRPFFLEFEDGNGIIPTHMVGLWWDSRFETAAGKVLVGVMTGNGSSIVGDSSSTGSIELNPNSAGDNDNNKAVSAHVSIEPSAVAGLGVGLSGNVSKVRIEDAAGTFPTDLIDQQIWAADLTYMAHNVEFLSEYYLWKNDSQTNNKTYDKSSAYYAQAGYIIAEQFTPYVRYEVLDAKSDPYFDAVGMTQVGVDRKKSRGIVGLRYDLNYRSSIKGEYRAVDDDQEGSYNEGAVQWTFSF